MIERSSLKRWLYLVLSLLAVAPLIVVGTILVWHSLEIQKQHVLEMQSTLSRQAAKEIRGTIEELTSNLIESVQLLDISALEKERQRFLLSTLRAKADRDNRNIITELSLLDTQGRQIARSSYDQILLESDYTDQSESPEFRVPIESNAIYYSPVWFDKGTGDPRMQIGVPLHNIRSTEIEAVLVTKLRLKELWEIVTSLPIGASGIAYMLTDSGRVIAHPNPSVVLKGKGFAVPENNGLHSGLDGGNVLLTREPLRLGDQFFVIVTEIPLEEALKPTLHNLSIIVLCIALAILASIVLGYLIIRRIIGPLGKVTKAASAISDGDYSQGPIEAEYSGDTDEIGYLAETFNLMTERIQIREHDLRYAIQEAEAATKIKSEFLATMSHELRTPMNGVMGFTELLKQTELSDKQGQYLEIIDQSGNSLLTILNDILDFSSIESEKLALQSEPFNPRECVTAALALMTPEAEHKGIQLKLSYADQNFCWLVGDQGRLRQILLNLISNAIKFSEQGEVTVQVKMRDLDSGNWMLNIQVHDTGIGINEKDIEQIFNPFTQGDSSCTRKYGGTGLGLAICKRLITLMGGKIGAHSVPGKGSTFWITVALPKATAHPHPVQQEISVAKNKQGYSADTKEQSPAHQNRVLLVEDDPSNQMLAENMLKQLEFQVMLASNGKEAIQQMEQSPCDLILMDCQMPIMDGYQATRIIRSQGSNTPIIALTAHAMSYDRQRCLDAGMNDYISKPFRKDDLATVLNRWLPGKSSFAQ